MLSKLKSLETKAADLVPLDTFSSRMRVLLGPVPILFCGHVLFSLAGELLTRTSKANLSKRKVEERCWLEDIIHYSFVVLYSLLDLGSHRNSNVCECRKDLKWCVPHAWQPPHHPPIPIPSSLSLCLSVCKVYSVFVCACMCVCLYVFAACMNSCTVYACFNPVIA